MRILVANKFWYPRGGLERVMFDEIRWLEQAGHEVAHFAAAHPENVASPWSDYFAPYAELGVGSDLGLGGRVGATARMFHNGQAAAQFGRLVSDFDPDVVHVHGIHRQLSPSILGVTRHRSIPVVQTVHDFHHICPADHLIRGDGQVCEPRRCGKLWYGPAISGRCVRGSLAASSVSAAETAWQRLRRAYERGVARFVCPSRFMAERLVEGGWETPCDVVPNAVEPGAAADTTGEGFVIASRLVALKGVEIALEAARRAGVPLTVLGDGPLEDSLRRAHPEADFRGHVSPDDVGAVLARSRAVVVPSRALENAPMSVLEAMAAGVPVIASSIGGIPEQIADGVDGVLVPPGDIDALADAMTRLGEDASLAASLGSAARDTAARRFSPQRHMTGLLDSYRAAGAPA